MSTDTTYNGWTNYPTWCVHLWLTNDEGTQETMRAYVDETYSRHFAEQKGEYGAEKVALSYTADDVQNFVEAMAFPDDCPASYGSDGMNGDLLQWAFGQVNWHEIARAFLEDAA